MTLLRLSSLCVLIPATSPRFKKFCSAFLPVRLAGSIAWPETQFQPRHPIGMRRRNFSRASRELSPKLPEL